MKRTMKLAALSVMTGAALAFAVGCGGGSSDGDGGSGENAGASSENAVAVMPAGFFTSSAPEVAPMLIDVKNESAVGDEVTFTARIGGKRNPFTGSAAMFLIVDPSLKSCDQIPGDNCKFPWDYCCEPKDNLRAHMGTVQVVDAEGMVITGSLRDHEGLTGGATIVVTGTVSEKNDEGSFVVDASNIHVVTSG